jgi:hypothetical protein
VTTDYNNKTLVRFGLKNKLQAIGVVGLKREKTNLQIGRLVTSSEAFCLSLIFMMETFHQLEDYQFGKATRYENSLGLYALGKVRFTTFN